MPSPLALLRQLRPPADGDPLTGYARTRDPLLLAELVRRHGGLAWGVCRRALPHRPDAEDAYQATWLVLAGNPGAVRSPAALPAFLHTVAVRTSRRVRHQRPVTATADHLPARTESADRDALAALDDELAKLPDTLRRPLLLCHLDGATQAEAARTLGLSLSTLKRRLEDGKDLLRTRLTGRGVDATVLTTAGVMGVGAPAVTAGGATAAATSLSTEVVTAMWVLKAKGWAAGLVVAAGVSATGGGLMLANGQGPPGGGAGRGGAAIDPPPAVTKPADTPAASAPAIPVGMSADEEKMLRAQVETMRKYMDLDKEIRRMGAIPKDEASAFVLNYIQAYRQYLTARLALAKTRAERQAVADEAVADATETQKYYADQAERGLCRAQIALQALAWKYETMRLQFLESVRPAVPVAAAPSPLLQERITLARKYIRLDREIREIGAIPKEEASSFVINLTATARELSEAVAAADPTPAGRLAAAREWYVNTRDAELYYQDRATQGLNRETVRLGAALARNRAQTTLVQAIEAASPADRERLTPFAAATASYVGAVSSAGGGWGSVKPAAGLKPQTALRVSRGGKPVGVLVVTQPDTPGDSRDTAAGVMLPNPDGTIPELQAGDVVRP